MLSDNDRFRDFLGLGAWGDYTGEGMVVATAENFELGTGHPLWTYQVFKEFCPNAEVIYLPLSDTYFESNIRAIKERGVSVWFSSKSTQGGVNQGMKEMLDEISDTCTLIVSAGNKGDEEYNRYMEDDRVIGIGMYTLYADGTIWPCYNTAVSDLVDFSFPTYINTPTSTGSAVARYGTSFSGPVAAAVLTRVNQFVKKATGKTLSAKNAYQFFQDYAKDFFDAGFDTHTGWGAPILPDPKVIDIWKYWEASDMDYTDKTLIPKWATDSVALMTDLGIMGGNEKGEFMPTKTVTRSEVAVALTNMYRKLVGKSD